MDSLKFKASSNSFIVEIEKIKNKYPLKQILIVCNKIDQLTEEELQDIRKQLETLNLKQLFLSAKENIGVDELKNQLLSFVNTGALRNNETIVTNTRHYDSLLKALDEIQKVKYGLET